MNRHRPSIFIEPKPAVPPPPQPCGAATASLALGLVSLCGLAPLTALPALVCGFWALRRMKISPVPLLGHSRAVAGLVTAALSVVFVPVVAWTVVPAVHRAHVQHQQIACSNNLRQLARICLLYAADHNQTLPRTWDDIKAYAGGAEALQRLQQCPAHAGAEASYELLHAGHRLSEFPRLNEVVIVREIQNTHSNGRNVGFADVHVEWVKTDPERLP